MMIQSQMMTNEGEISQQRPSEVRLGEKGREGRVNPQNRNIRKKVAK